MTPRVFFDDGGRPYPATRLDADGVADGARLPRAAFEEIRDLAADGERRLAAGDLRGAFEAFRKALAPIPDPLEAWNATGWLLVAMAECAVRAGDWKRALPPLRDAMRCPGTHGNPWFHLRYGMTRLELADAGAAEHLARALRACGRTIFDGLDAKYLAAAEEAFA